MGCIRIRKLLIPYVEGALPEEMRRTVEDHLAGCGACAGEMAELTRTVDIISHTDYPVLEPAANLRSRVMERVLEKPVRRSWWPSGLPTYSAAAVALILFAVVIFSFDPSSYRMPSESPQQMTIPEPAPLEKVESPSEMILEPGVPDAASPRPSPGKLPPDVEFADGHAKSIQRGAEIDRPTRKPETRDGEDGMRVGMDKSKVEGAFGFEETKLHPKKPTDRFGLGTRSVDGKFRNEYSLTQDEEALGTLKVDSIREAPGSLGLHEPIPEGHSAAVSQAPYGGGKRAVPGPPGPMGPAGPPGMPEMPAAMSGIHAEPAPVDGSYEEKSLLDKVDFGFSEKRMIELESRARQFPSSKSALEELHAAYRDSGRKWNEYTVAQQLTGLDPDNAMYWYARAQAAEKINMPRTASASYHQAIKMKLAQPELGRAESRLKALEAELKK